MTITQLLAPTWQERKLASQEIFEKIVQFGEADAKTWVEQQVNMLPQPQYFIQNLIIFWGQFTEKEFELRMGQFPNYSVKSWHPKFQLAQEFELANIPTEDLDFMVSLGVIQVIQSLGFFAHHIEDLLMDCITHPDISFRYAAEVALEDSKLIRGNGFKEFWYHLCLLTDDHYHRRKMVAKYITPANWLLLLESIETGKPFNEKWQDYPARLALESLPFVNDEVSKLAYDYLTQHFFDKRPVNTQASYIHTLTRLSQKHGFNKKIAQYCQDNLTMHRDLDFHEMDSLYSAYTDYLSLYDVKKMQFTLQQIDTPWALSTLCDNLAVIKNPPLDLIVNTVIKSLGNYNGYDGAPNDNTIELLISNPEYAIECRYIIASWWYRACQDYLTHNTFELDVLQDVIKLIDVLGQCAKPMLEGLYLALNNCLKDEIEGGTNLWREPYATTLLKLGYTQRNFNQQIQLDKNNLDQELSDEYEPTDITLELMQVISKLEEEIRETTQ